MALILIGFLFVCFAGNVYFNLYGWSDSRRVPVADWIITIAGTVVFGYFFLKMLLTFIGAENAEG